MKAKKVKRPRKAPTPPYYRVHWVVSAEKLEVALNSLRGEGYRPAQVIHNAGCIGYTIIATRAISV